MNATHDEEDHFISLELGGNPTDPKNLWLERWGDASASSDTRAQAIGTGGPGRRVRPDRPQVVLFSAHERWVLNPRTYREAPPALAFMAEIENVRGADRRLDVFVQILARQLADRNDGLA